MVEEAWSCNIGGSELQRAAGGERQSFPSEERLWEHHQKVAMWHLGTCKVRHGNKGRHTRTWEQLPVEDLSLGEVSKTPALNLS